MNNSLYIRLTSLDVDTYTDAWETVAAVQKAAEAAQQFWDVWNAPPSPPTPPLQRSEANIGQNLRKVIEEELDYERNQPNSPPAAVRPRFLDFSEISDVEVRVELAPSPPPRRRIVAIFGGAARAPRLRRRRTAVEMLEDQNRRFRQWKK